MKTQFPLGHKVKKRLVVCEIVSLYDGALGVILTTLLNNTLQCNNDSFVCINFFCNSFPSQSITNASFCVALGFLRAKLAFIHFHLFNTWRKELTSVSTLFRELQWASDMCFWA